MQSNFDYQEWKYSQIHKVLSSDSGNVLFQILACAFGKIKLGLFIHMVNLILPLNFKKHHKKI